MNYSQVEVAFLNRVASHVADDSFTGVYILGCGFLDLKCYACELCHDIYGDLVDAGSEEACDAACIGIAEAAGGGPGDGCPFKSVPSPTDPSFSLLLRSHCRRGRSRLNPPVRGHFLVCWRGHGPIGLQSGPPVLIHHCMRSHLG
jgi:hypothetical protein